MFIACLEREPFSSTCSLAGSLDVLPATILSRLHNSLGMESFHLCWVPHPLTDDLRQLGIAKSGELLRALEAVQRSISTTSSQAMRADFASNISTPHNGRSLSMKCPKGWAGLSARYVLTAIWGVNDSHLPDLRPAQCRFNAQYFLGHGMEPLVQTVFPQGRTWYTPQLSVHLHNCRVHFSKMTGQFSSRISCCTFPTRLIVPTWPRWTSGHPGVSRLDSLAEHSPSPKNYYKVFENFWREFQLRN
jgi:hypothetical protein